jgi:hypothetical protein
MRYRNIIRLVILSLSVVFMATLVFSQPQKPKGHVPPMHNAPPHGDNEKPAPKNTEHVSPPIHEDPRWNRIEEFKKLKMIEELNLSEEESVKFFAKHNLMTNQYKEIEKQKNKCVTKLEKMLSEQASDSDIKKEVDNFLSIEQKIFKNKSAFISDVEKIIGQKKVASYIIFENNFHKELQKIMRDSRKPPFEK